jgi:hypothetical protein
MLQSVLFLLSVKDKIMIVKIETLMGELDSQNFELKRTNDLSLRLWSSGL